MDDLMSVDDAAATVDARAAPFAPRVESVALTDAAGRRSAGDVRADRDYPPFDKSLLDGYAVAAGQAAGEFEVIGELPAGRVWDGPAVGGRRVVSIMTGAPMPRGNGPLAVVPVERSGPAGLGRVRLDDVPATAAGVSRRGSDRPAGALLIERGTILGPHHVAALASVGLARVGVYERPRCVVLSTGDEIVAVDETPGPAQVRDANAPMLVALLQRLGCDATDAGRVADEPQATRDALQQALNSPADAVFVSGGVSMGDRDFVPRCLIELGVQLHVTKLRVKPGKPFVFGTLGRKAVFALPGNPVSAYACTLLLAARWLARLSGGDAGECDARFVTRPLANDLPANGPRQFYQPAVFEDEAVRPLAWRGSADVFTLAQAHALIERPAGDGPRRVGDPVRVLPLP